jgi:predicted ATP-grasp superfamily ATP-dependent carboligase
VTAVGVVGASGRAAVMSAARAGFSAWAVDLFADRDLRRLAPAARCPADRYPDALPELAAAFPPGPVLYTGGLENHPGVVRRLAETRPLWGNPPDVLERVRDPFRLHAALTAAGLPAPRVAPAAEQPLPGRWVRKPLRSAGGTGVRFAAPGDCPSTAHYLQEFIDGRPMSAVFVGSTDGTDLLGVTDQLVGEPRLHARPFAYCGNVGPAEVPASLDGSLREMGSALGRAFGLRGLWGADFILNSGTPYPVEVNPRYTSSAEVLEHAGGIAVLERHAAAFGQEAPPLTRRVALLRGGLSPGTRCAGSAAGVNRGGEAGLTPLAGGSSVAPVAPPRPAVRGEVAERRAASEAGEGFCRPHFVGKAIYYSPHRITFPPCGPWDADLTGDPDPWRLPGFADIPEPGEVVEPGHPVLTFLATDETPTECRERLQSRAAELDRLFG